MALRDHTHNYARLRGLPAHAAGAKPTGQKLLEEVGELLIALANDDQENIQEELADCAGALDVIAELRGVTVEACVDAKAIKDAGRGASKGTV